MKILAVLLHALLLEVLSYQQDKCRKEEGSVLFYIYNANVDVTIYPCIINEGHVTDICKRYNYTDEVDDHVEIIDKCIKTNFDAGTVSRRGATVYNKHNGLRVDLTLCKLQGLAKILDNILDSRIGQPLYTNGKLYNVNHSHYVFWIPSICQEMNLIYSGYFNVWSLQTGTKYIRNKNINLKLTERIILCSSEIWKTDYDGIIVSTQRIQTRTSSNLPQKYNTTFPYDCEDITTNDFIYNMVNQSTTNHYTTLNNKNNVGELTDKSNKGVNMQANNDGRIKNLKISVQWLLFVLIILFMWYLFNVIVNFSSLRREGKKRTSKSRTYLWYCLSQSLTNRYLYLDEWTHEETEPKRCQSQQQLYESVE